MVIYIEKRKKNNVNKLFLADLIGHHVGCIQSVKPYD